MVFHCNKSTQGVLTHALTSNVLSYHNPGHPRKNRAPEADTINLFPLELLCAFSVVFRQSVLFISCPHAIFVLYLERREVSLILI